MTQRHISIDHNGENKKLASIELASEELVFHTWPDLAQVEKLSGLSHFRSGGIRGSTPIVVHVSGFRV